MSSPFPILNKPRFGDECNRCGRCCLRAQCPQSESVFGKREVCPALDIAQDGTTTCGLVAHPETFDDPKWIARVVDILQLLMGSSYDRPGQVFGRTLGIGRGCDALDREGIDADVTGNDFIVHRIFEERIHARRNV